MGLISKWGKISPEFHLTNNKTKLLSVQLGNSLVLPLGEKKFGLIGLSWSGY